MNDLDRTTFAQFVERFARIERRVPPAPTIPAARASQRRRFARVSPRVGLATIGILLVGSIGFATIGTHPSPAPSPSPTHVSLPADSAGPADVFAAYLRALQAGDCNTAHLLGDPQLLSGNFLDLCTTTQVTGFTIIGDPVVESPYRVRVTATITTTGLNGDIGPGGLRAVYWLQHQSSGAWRISDGVISVRPDLLPTTPADTAQGAGFLAPPFSGFPGQNSALVIVDARSGEQATTFGPCDGALCGLP